MPISDHAKAYNRSYYQAHKDKSNAYRRKWYAEHQDEQKARSRKYYAGHGMLICGRRHEGNALWQSLSDESRYTEEWYESIPMLYAVLGLHYRAPRARRYNSHGDKPCPVCGWPMSHSAKCCNYCRKERGWMSKV